MLTSRRRALAASVALAFELSQAAHAAGPGGPRGPGRAAPVAALSPGEASFLAFTREEEKLARDLYLMFDETWSAPPFASIASSEQRHMDAALRLLVKYDLPDPAAGNPIGEFENPLLQALHDSLAARGSTGLVPALLVGGYVEELDLRDLASAAADTTRADLDRVYEALACGSRNHLRAFAGSYFAAAGQPYTAQLLPQEDVDRILRQPWERCGNT